MSNDNATAALPQPVVSESAAWTPHAPLVTGQQQAQPPQHALPIAEPPPTTTNPTPRDRAYTYVMHLSVTRVRDICRASGLKQFGKKSESQPRLFWGAESLISGEETLNSWCDALPGLREWINAPHREQSTLWRIAPPRNARPLDFHTYFAHTLTARRGGVVPPVGTGSIPLRDDDDMEDEDTIAIAVGDTPTERDRLYTYARSLSITVVRRLCKRLGLKQFGRKRESQKRLWWHLTSPDYNPIVDEEGELDPRADGIRWANTVTPDRWFRAPEEEARPASAGVRLRDRAVQRRKKFSANELARLVAVLVSSPEMRQRFCVVLQSRRTGGGNEAAFWAANVAPIFNDAGFVPRLNSAVTRDAPSSPNTAIEPRGGDELRRHFDRACPAFVRAFRRWSADSAQPIKFASYLRERRRSDTGAPLSPTEKRASIFFVVLKCGEEDQYTDVLQAVLDNTDGGIDIKAEEELRPQPQHQPMPQVQQAEQSPQQVHPQQITHQPHQPQDQQQQPPQPVHTTEQLRLVVPPDPLPVATTVAPETAQVTQVEPVTVAVSEPVVHPLPTTSVAAQTPPTTEITINQAGQAYATESPVATAVAGSTTLVEEGNGSGILGKRPRVSVEALKEEVDMLKKKVDEMLAPAAKMQRSVLRAQQEQQLNESIITARKLKKQLDADPGEGNERLRAVNAATIERLTRDIEELSKQQ